jgi:CHAD domain-containing protein
VGPLRDLQVQLHIIADMSQEGPIGEFKQSLERRESRQIAVIHKDLKRGTKRRLTFGVKKVRDELLRLRETAGDEKIQSGVERVLKSRRNEFLKARKRFKPADEETLHAMRIALKKFRYAVEAAQPLLSESAKERARDMQAFQGLLGDTRDVELLRTRLERWAAKKGNKIAVVPALESLQERRQGLMQKIVESAPALDNIFPDEQFRPAMEKTLAVETSSAPNAASRLRAVAVR